MHNWNNFLTSLLCEFWIRWWFKSCWGGVIWKWGILWWVEQKSFDKNVQSNVVAILKDGTQLLISWTPKAWTAYGLPPCNSSPVTGTGDAKIGGKGWQKKFLTCIISFKGTKQLQELLLPEIHSVKKTFYKDFHYLIQ